MLHVRGLHATYEAYYSKVLQGSWPEETEPADCAEATACDALLERWELRVLIVSLSANALLPTPFQPTPILSMCSATKLNVESSC